MYLLPSLFTAGNIAAGYFAITQSLQGSILSHTISTTLHLRSGSRFLLIRWTDALRA